MNREQIETGVIEIVHKLTGIPADQTVSPLADFKTDLGFDSLLEAEFGMEVEDRFEIQVPDGVHPRNVREVTDLILTAQTRNAACRS